MNGAEALVATAISGGVEICFANPGTTELPLALALDSVPGLRSILCLLENVATGAADGYGRMAAKPAMCLLHLGQGLANGLTNLHNARRGAERYRRPRHLAPACRSVAGDRCRVVGSSAT